MIAMRWPSFTASSRSWLTNRMVFFNCCWNVSNSSWSRARISGSSAENGSSISRIGASVAKARARPTRWRIPPDNSLTRHGPHSVRPTSSSWARTCARRSAAGTPASSSPSPTLSSTVRHGSRATFWKTMATWAPRKARKARASQVPGFTQVSPSRTVQAPRTTGFSALTARSRVDLPEPDRPISATISPSPTSSAQSCTPRIWPVRSLIVSRLSPSSISGSAAPGSVPNTMETRSKRIIGAKPPSAPLMARRARETSGRARWPAPRSPSRPRSPARC